MTHLRLVTSATTPDPTRRAPARARKNLASFVVSVFGTARLTRWVLGGRWELWYVDWPVCAEVWHIVDDDAPPGSRPTPLCRGRVIAIEKRGRGLIR